MRHAIPNLVTASRGAAGFLVAYVLVGPLPDRLAFWVFVAAVFTDLFDGWLARRLGATSTLGQWLDPISDKVLTDVCWIALWWVGWAPAWLAWTILARDVIVAAGFTVAWRRGLTYAPSPSGRLMVSFEGIALAVLLFHGPWLAINWQVVGLALGALTLALSLGSAVEYLAVGPAARASLPGPETVA